ncbi:MAG: DnaJ family domain-containing protein [Anaerolineae bacterium]
MSARDWESAVDKAIREAMERGEFDDLPGKGQPLKLERNPYVGDWEMAFKLLQDAGYVPEWIERDKEVRAELEACRKLLADHLAWHRQALRELEGRPPQEAAHRQAELEARERVMAAYRKRATALNRKIETLNLMVPTPRLQRPKVAIEEEIQRFERELDTLVNG